MPLKAVFPVMGSQRQQSQSLTASRCAAGAKAIRARQRERQLYVDSGRSISRDEGCRRVELTGSKLLSGTVGRVQAFRTAYGSFVTDTGPSRAAL